MCVHIFTYIYTHKYIRVYIYTYIHIYIHKNMYIYIFTFIYTYIYIFLYTYIYIEYTDNYIYILMCVCMLYNLLWTIQCRYGSFLYDFPVQVAICGYAPLTQSPGLKRSLLKNIWKIHIYVFFPLQPRSIAVYIHIIN